MRHRRKKLPVRSGMALMLVLPAVALTGVLAYAVLANTGTQDQISSNAQLLSQADCAAESGINYGLYALQQGVANQSVSPISFTNTVQTGGLQNQFTVSVATTKIGLTINSTITSVGTITKDTNTIKRTLVMNVVLNLSADFGNSGSTGLHASGHNTAPVSSGSGSLSTSTSSGRQPVTNVQILNWAQ